tara:strand:- start:94 stop:606 length:513 start_codon:yes stop_codon:yes gene_type:complete
MSKRGSRNAKSFAGKNWSIGRKFKIEKGKKKTKISKHKEKRNELRKEQLNLICEKFDFAIKNEEDKNFYNSLLVKFLKYRAMKGSRQARKNVKNVNCFKVYCFAFNKRFDIRIYFNEKYNLIDFETKYPELNFKSNKRSIRKTKTIKSEHKLIDMLSDKTIKFLKNRNKK